MRKDERLGMLPDPFIMRDGRRVQTMEEWEARRQEILEDTIGLEFDTGQTWGMADNYDICLDSNVIGIERCADIIVSLTKD